jgi:hypothetical protein
MHPGQNFSFLISQIIFEKMKFSDIRNQGIRKKFIKNEDTQNKWMLNKKHKLKHT